MPVINVKVIENFFTEEQKRLMIGRLTDAFVACAGVEGVRPYVYVQIEEVKQGYWGLGGHILPDADFLVNGVPQMFDSAAAEFSQIYGVPMRSGGAAPATNTASGASSSTTGAPSGGTAPNS
jgi:4-oxalocrotonate tautomerase